MLCHNLLKGGGVYKKNALSKLSKH